MLRYIASETYIADNMSLTKIKEKVFDVPYDGINWNNDKFQLQLVFCYTKKLKIMGGKLSMGQKPILYILCHFTHLPPVPERISPHRMRKSLM